MKYISLYKHSHTNTHTMRELLRKVLRFTVHETPTKNLLRFVKYDSQFSSENCICSFCAIRCDAQWFLSFGFALFCILQSGTEKRKMSENAHHFKCVLNAFLMAKARQRKKSTHTHTYSLCSYTC